MKFIEALQTGKMIRREKDCCIYELRDGHIWFRLINSNFFEQILLSMEQLTAEDWIPFDYPDADFKQVTSR